jgi:hypothetical protein
MVAFSRVLCRQHLLTGCSVSAVAAGAVARALNKDNGPKRYAQCSYGLMRLEPYEPKVFPAHVHATAKEDKLDGDRYVKVINYFMIRVQCLPSSKSVRKFYANTR